MQRFLVTGANGFVGKYLCEGLKKAFPQAEISALTLNGKASFDYVKPYKADMARDDLCAILREIKPTLVYHLAAHSSVAQALGAGHVTFEENTFSCLNLAKAMRQEVPTTPLVFASSSEVYGAAFKNHEAVSVAVAPEPMNAYARSKLAGEFIFKDMLSDISPVIILRLFNHYGKGQDERFVMGSFMAQIARIKSGEQAPTIKVGNLEAVRDFLTVEDVIEVYVNLARKTHDTQFEILNICSGQGRSIQSMLDELIEQSGMKIAIEVDKSRLRASDIPRAVGISSF